MGWLSHIIFCHSCYIAFSIMTPDRYPNLRRCFDINSPVDGENGEQQFVLLI